MKGLGEFIRDIIQWYVKNDSFLKDRRQELRAKQTDAELALWQRLRAKRFFGNKFYRQYSVGKYILDLYCPKLSLAIEIDGGQHAESEQYDAARTAYLGDQGIKVVRFWNNDVLRNVDGVLEELMKYTQ